MNFLYQQIKHYLLLEKGHFTDSDNRTWKLSALRVILLSGTILTLLILTHSSYVAYSLDMPFVLAITSTFFVLLVAILCMGKSLTHLAAAGLLLMVVLACISILLFVPDFEAAKFGLLFLFTLPLFVRLFFSNKAALVAMMLNLIPYALLIRNAPLPQLFDIDISLPQTHTYLSSLVFLFFNFCLPLALMRFLTTLDKQSEVLARQSSKLAAVVNRYQEIFDNGGTASFFCDQHGTILQANQAARDLIKQAGGQRNSLQQLFQFDEPLSANKKIRGKLKVPPHDHYELQPASLVHHKKQLIHCHNISQQDSFKRLYFLDSLTGLRNHNFWYERAFLRLKRPKALFLLKLTNLREVNIQHGLDIGDQLLIELTRQLRRKLPQQVHFYRFPGAKLMLAVPSELFHHIAPSSWLTQQLPGFISLSINEGYLDLLLDWRAGISQHRQGSPANLLMEECAIALSRTDSKHPVVEYEQIYSRSIHKNSLLRDKVKQYLDERALELWLQPQFNVQREVIGYEALARIRQQANQTVLTPQQFLPQIDQHDWHVQFSSQVLSKAIEMLSHWPPQLKAVPLAINLAGPEILDDNFYARLLRYYTESSMLRQRLELEITETSAMASHDETRKRLTCLAQLGVCVIIDDFGTGHASLSQLIDISASTLKIDREFINGIPHSQRHLKLVQATLELATKLNLQAIAEGVETNEQLDLLISMGCDRFQGYLLGKPMPLAYWTANAAQLV
ncbi:GGDEF domain-containing phosphodiesterase [Bowmanella denitrificans]|uniref:GGDEF domain-containing phosphodiesterase n=1 Tax=Bowmanella denitrificans TaxID=366582 RepID=A0ABP3GML8_9ALTE